MKERERDIQREVERQREIQRCRDTARALGQGRGLEWRGGIESWRARPRRGWGHCWGRCDGRGQAGRAGAGPQSHPAGSPGPTLQTTTAVSRE